MSICFSCLRCPRETRSPPISLPKGSSRRSVVSTHVLLPWATTCRFIRSFLVGWPRPLLARNFVVSCNTQPPFIDWPSTGTSDAGLGNSVVYSWLLRKRLRILTLQCFTPRSSKRPPEVMETTLNHSSRWLNKTAAGSSGSVVRSSSSTESWVMYVTHGVATSKHGVKPTGFPTTGEGTFKSQKYLMILSGRTHGIILTMKTLSLQKMWMTPVNQKIRMMTQCPRLPNRGPMTPQYQPRSTNWPRFFTTSWLLTRTTMPRSLRSSTQIQATTKISRPNSGQQKVCHTWAAISRSQLVSWPVWHLEPNLVRLPLFQMMTMAYEFTLDFHETVMLIHHCSCILPLFWLPLGYPVSGHVSELASAFRFFRKAPRQRGVCVKHLNRCKTSTGCTFSRFLFWKLQFHHSRGTQHFTGTVSNEATSEMGYPAWPAGRTCISFISSSGEEANARTTLPICFFKLCQSKPNLQVFIPRHFSACTVFAKSVHRITAWLSWNCMPLAVQRILFDSFSSPQDGVWQRWCVKEGVSKMVCVCVKDGVWQSGVSKVVGDKVVCERWCVKDAEWQSAVWKMVCQRWCVTKLGVKDGVWQRWCVKEGVSKMVCESWCVTKWCLKDGLSKMVGDKVGCERCERGCVGAWQSSATPAIQNEGGCCQGPRLPHKVTVDVTKCHACHKKVTGRHRRLKPTQARQPVP